MELRVRLWASKTDFKVSLGREVTSLKAETMRTETLCMASGLRVRYETLGPDYRHYDKPVGCGNIQQLQSQ